MAVAPKYRDEVLEFIFAATHERHPTFIRYPRGPGEGVPVKEFPRLIEVGKAEVIQGFSNNGGPKIALFALGSMISLGRETAKRLAAQGYHTALINPRFIHPLHAGPTPLFAPPPLALTT